MSAKIKSPTHGPKTGHKHKPRGLSDKKFENVYWPYIPLILIAGLILVLTSQTHVLATMLRHPTSQVLAYATDLSPDSLLSDTNSARLANNDKPLHLNSYLSQAAQAKAHDMASRDYWSHDTPEGNPPWIFVDAQGYHYQKLGENLATGFSNAQSTINGWMASTEHRQNMLDGAYSEVGFGYANIPNYKAAGGGAMTIVVAFYGQPAGVSDLANGQLTARTQIPSSNDSLSAPQLAATTSRAQIALARLPLSSHATTLAIIGVALAAGFWIGRHALGVRRAAIQGETFIIAHPLMDVGLVLVGFALFALTRTAGFVH